MDIKLEDSTSERVPQHFMEIVKKILSNCDSSDLAKQQIFLTMVMYIISENGLTLKIDESQADIDCKNVTIYPITKWKQPSGIYVVPLIMPSFNDTNIKLIMLPMDSSVLLDIFIKNNNYEVYTACLPITQYIVSLESSNIVKMFHNIKHLSFTLKKQDNKSSKSSVLKFFGYISASLIGLPQELLFNILINLPILDIVNTAKTCTRLNLLLKNENFWHNLFKRDFKNEIKDKNMDWKTAYIKSYSSLHASRTPHNLGSTLFDYMDFPENNLPAYYPLSFL